jgi:branched-chain amino acid transport system permease protein
VQIGQTILNGLTYGGLLFLVSSGFTVMFGLMRVLNLAHGAFYLWGSYLGLVVVGATGSFLAGIVVAAVAIGVLGLVTEVALFRRVRGNPVSEVLLTLGLGFLLGDLALAFFGGNPEQIPVPEIIGGSQELFGITFPRYRLMLFAIAVILFALLRFTLVGTRLGALVRAGVDDAEMLEALGTNINRLATGVFVVSAALVGATGVLGGAFLGVHPGGDIDILVLAVVVVIIGGLGSLDGAAIGSVLIGLLVSVGSVFAPEFLYFIIFAPVILLLFFRPRGLLGVSG